MQIDGNPKAIKLEQAYKRGDRDLGRKLQDEFIEELREALKTQDHCSCTNQSCSLHGHCVECVAMHRAHKGHLPNCFKDMVNERLAVLSELTEHSVSHFIEKQK
jgi:hypothetical protein